jgi:uncharacterized protein YjbI with pentapeptide repeats
MANDRYIELLDRGVSDWNNWCESNPGVTADLREADLEDFDLCGADLNGAHLSGATLCGAILTNAELIGACKGWLTAAPDAWR